MDMISFDNKVLGTFRLESGRAVVSDPCYSPGSGCLGIVQNVKPGLWRAWAKVAEVPGRGVRVWELRCMHSGIDAAFRGEEELIGEFGVDSGQFGVFEAATYRELSGDEEWYQLCCEVTCEKLAGTITNGAVASSGFGDGAYSVFAWRDGSREAAAIRVVFIDLDDLEDR